jgi:hypothetical protein
MFNISFIKLVQWIMPTWLRNANATIMVLAANYPLREVHNQFKDYVDAVDYRLKHNYQTCYLQAMLNDKFDLIDRRIRVIDFEVWGALFFFDDSENRDLNCGDDNVQFFWADDVGYDYTIQIPSTIVTTNAEMASLRANVNRYKLAGKQFYIQRT